MSIDCKHKELVGEYAQAGREWQPGGNPVEVNGHDCPAGSPKRSPTASMTSAPTRAGSRRVADHRCAIGTRKGARRLTPWGQAVYILRFLLDGSRIKQLALDNALPRATAYEYLWEGEGLEVLATCAPTLHDAIDAARGVGDVHIGLDGALIHTNRSRIEGPTDGCDLFYSGKHHRHGANLQVLSAPDGFPRCGSAKPGPAASTTRPPRTKPVWKPRSPCSTSTAMKKNTYWSWPIWGTRNSETSPLS